MHEKALYKIGAVIAHNRSKMHSCDHFGANFGLPYINRNPKEFVLQFVTMDETWIHHYTPKSREGSKQWVEPGESAPKRPKAQQSTGQVMASDFWDAHGVIFIDYFEEGTAITEAYYAPLLD